MDVLANYVDQIFGPLLNPQKRVFIGYLLSALLIALIVPVVFGRAGLRTTLGQLFDRRIWLSKSARTDYLVLMFNQVLMMGLAPRLISKLFVATIIFEGLHIWLNGRVSLWPGAPAWAIASFFTLTLFLLDDATKYLLHRALHRWPALWCFHQVHHSAEVLTPFTVYRTHPVEAVLFGLRSKIVQAFAISIFLFFFGDRTSLMSILGANVFLFAFNAAGSNLRHSHVWISYGRSWEQWLISPAQHQIHHSVEERHYDRNFGAVLSVWDRIGGSLELANDQSKPRGYGLGKGASSPHSLFAIYLGPIFQALELGRKSIVKVWLSTYRSKVLDRRNKSIKEAGHET
ncbi:MAG: sterol desaturase family protein [Hyphomicrobiaceae bacterium]